jgi:predicted porin
MQKKLLVAAVAGALALPGLAMAQSSVTISGVFKVGIDNYKISNTARTGNLSETRITDNSSRIIFGITEDIGGGLSAIGQLDARPQLDTNTSALSAGNSWVGLRSTSWGTVTMGRHDLHYGKQPDDIAAKAGALMASSVSLMDSVQTTAGTTAAIAGNTRTNNVLRYDSPNWSGFAFTGAYSANPGGIEADLGSAIRRGAAWNFNPSYTTSNWQVGWSYWNQKADGVAAGNNQKSNVFYGYMLFGGFKVGLALNKSVVESEAVAGTTKIGDRNAWTIPVRWESGPHNVYFHYTKAGNNKAPGAPGSDGARMWAAAYAYDLSKRTSVGVTIADLNNDTNAAYNFFTNTGTLGSTGSTLTLGEDGRLYALTVRHAF